MSKDEENNSTNGGAEASPKSFIERLSQALLGEPSNRQELVSVLRDATGRDLLSQDALDMIEGVLQVTEMQVRDVMIPRAQVDVVDVSQTPEEYLPTVIETAHSRFPFIDGDKDKVLGILLAKDLLRYFYISEKDRNREFVVNDFLRPAIFVPESKRLNILLKEFRTSRNHMAIVVDEYGGVSGIITIEDVLEQIVGEIEDEYDVDEDDVSIRKRDDDNYLVKALTTIEVFNEYFNTSFSDQEIDTIGGLVMTSMGHLPKRKEKIVIDGIEFEILRADSRRVHLLKVKPLAKPGSATAN